MTRLLVRSNQTRVRLRLERGLLRRYRVTEGELGILTWCVEQEDSGWMFPRVQWDFDSQQIPTNSRRSDFHVVGIVTEQRRILFDSTDLDGATISPFQLR